MSTSATEYAVCPWPIDEGCMPPEWATMDPALKDRSIALASASLHRLTGFRVGGCPVTVRPCKSACRGQTPSYWSLHGATSWWPQNWGGVWINGCGCTTDCSCEALCEVVLPAPVGEVLTVKVGGIAVDPADYRVDQNRLLWTGISDCPWPACQNMAAADDQPNTFSITYLNSYPVDGMGAYAAGVLAAEFAKACTTGKCRLPATVTAVSRQGISYDITAGTFPNGTTGIREIDAYIGLWNPEALRQQTKVWSPDVHPPRVTR
jgi:hypothetical protein